MTDDDIDRILIGHDLHCNHRIRGAVWEILSFAKKEARAQADSQAPVAWVNDLGAEQKLSFEPMKGAYEHRALVYAQSPQPTIADSQAPVAQDVAEMCAKFAELYWTDYGAGMGVEHACTEIAAACRDWSVKHCTPQPTIAPSVAPDLMQRVDYIDQQGYVHWRKNDDTKGQRINDDVAGRDRSLSGASAKNDPQLSPGQRVIEEAIGKLHIAASKLTDPRHISELIFESINKLNWISANPESFVATHAAPSVAHRGGDSEEPA